MLPLFSLYSHTENDSKGSKGTSANAEGQFESMSCGQIREKNSSVGFKGTLVYLILVSFIAQFLVAPVVSAGVVRGSSPREYTYTRYSPVTDDSWIGTPKVNSVGSGNSGNTGNSTTSTGNKGTTSIVSNSTTSTPVGSKIAGSTQISDGSWILPGKNSETVTTPTKPVKNGTSGNSSGNTGNIPLNSAPSNPTGGNNSNGTNTSQITYIPVSTSVPAGYTTPNGTLITNLPGTYTAPVAAIPYITLTSLSTLGALTYNNISGVFGINTASSTTTGALSGTDWNTFNNKINLTSLSSTGGITYNNTTGEISDSFAFSGILTRVGNSVSLINGSNGEILSMSGGIPVWLTPATVSVPVTTVFGRTGSVIGQAGDYTTSLIAEGTNLYYTAARFDTAFGTKTTDLLTEGTTNLYFTNLRAQNALSGTVAAITGSISGINSNIATITGSLATTNSNLATATGNIATNTADISSLSGTIAGINADISSLSGSLVSLNSMVDTLSGTVASNYLSLSGVISSTDSNLSILSGVISTLSSTVNTLSGNLVSLSSTVNILSGSLDNTNLDVSTISGSLALVTSTIGTLSGIISTLVSDVGTLSGELITINASIATLSGSINTLSGRVNSAEIDIDTLSGNLDITNTNLSTTNTTAASLSGRVNTTETNIATNTANIGSLSGNLSTLSGTVGTLSGVVATKISLTSLSVLGPLSYNNLTGVFGINIANSTTTGALSTTDWNTFNNKVGSINGLTGVTQTFAVGTTGTDFNISSIGGTHTFNIPDASTIARGFVSTGTQTFTGTKSFVNAPTFSSISSGSLLFAGTGGIVTQDNANFFWDNTNKRLGIGTNTPVANLHIQTTNTGDILKISSGSNNVFRIQTDTDLALDTAKVIIGSGNTAKPEGLARDQLYVYGRINSSWDDFRCDFLNPQQTIGADSYAVCGGLGYDVTTGGSLANISLAGISGSDRLATTAVAAGYASALSSMGQLKTERSLNPVFESRVIVNTATARSVVGFTDLGLGGTIAADTNNSNNEIFFRKTAAGTFWQTVTRSAAGVETVNTSTVTTAAMRALRIEVNNLAGKVLFYIDGNLVATHTTGIPLAATRLGFWVGITSSVAVVTTMDVDYIKFWSDDPDTKPQNNVNIASPISIDFDTLKGDDILPEIVWNSRSVLKDINYIYDRTGSGKTMTGSSIDEDRMTIEEYASYTTNTMKRSIEKLSGENINTDLNINNLKTYGIETQNLCLDGTCISSGQLISLLGSANSIDSKINSINNTPTTIVNNYTTQVIDNSTSTGNESSIVQSEISNIQELLNGKGNNTINTTQDLVTKKMEIGNIVRNTLTYITELVANGIQIIHDLVVLEITALYGYFDEIWARQINTKELMASGATINTVETKDIHMEKLCIKKSNGTEICLTGDQVEGFINTDKKIAESTNSTPMKVDSIITESVSGEIIETSISKDIMDSEIIVQSGSDNASENVVTPATNTDNVISPSPGTDVVINTGSTNLIENIENIQ